jgi:serine/threonine protein kinase/tetratricopeptide (TPR) repeat protein
MSSQDIRRCTICGTRLSFARPYCPLCRLREALSPPLKSERPLAATIPMTVRGSRKNRFDHYELVKGHDGRPIELGRGAMGITYKAFDTGLRCTVTLKVIASHCLSNRLTRSRFVREARAAASLRHPNVASVFHLGRDGKNYFYAMEFVEGETLENYIHRSGKLDIKPALEIAKQIAAGLAALHKRGLVHRDIKPSNIMVTLDEGGGITAKIIDLGLAKSVGGVKSVKMISTEGVFVGTPEFASPEQFAGIEVDIRSDLYGLGITLWQMLAGRLPFQGSPGELMYQHLHNSPPTGQLEDVPQPVSVLLRALLEKDPRRRLQTPSDLLEMIPAITDSIAKRRRFTIRRLEEGFGVVLHRESRKRSTPLGPKKISIARLPVTGSEVFGREEDIAFLDSAWANPATNVVAIVAWAGVGKSTLVNHWLRQLAVDHYRSAQVVFGWSFYRQGTSGTAFSSDEFLHSSLSWFGDRDPTIGTAWEKGERLAKLISRRRTLLILDGLEPLQYPPGPQEGRLREPGLQALIRELATFNKGLCLITTRQPVSDIADHERTSTQRRDLEHLSDDGGAKLLRAQGVKGSLAELRSASREFGGHSLALTLLGSYLSDAFSGDIRNRREVRTRLSRDTRHGVYARRVMESYQTWLGEGRELSLLRMLALFDRPTDEETFKALLTGRVIPGLTESLINLGEEEWQTTLSNLRRTKLLLGEDPEEPRYLDAHPLVREYFGEQLKTLNPKAWRECNRRLFHHYSALAPSQPNSNTEMEPLFLAVACGCRAGLFHAALHEVYIPRIQRGDASFAANFLAARGALLSVLVQFFENESWDSPVVTGSRSRPLVTEDRLLILMQSALNLTSTQGMGSAGARMCYERAESLCQTVNRPDLLYVALMGQWRYSSVTVKLSATLQVAQRIHTLALKLGEPSFLMGAFHALAITRFYLGHFESALSAARNGVELWRSGRSATSVEDAHPPPVVCLCFQALADWHLGEAKACHETMLEAVTLAKQLGDNNAVALALCEAADLGHKDRDPAITERFASELVELTARNHFAFFLAVGKAFLGWARGALGDKKGGLALIDEGIAEYQASGCVMNFSYLLGLKAEILYEIGRIEEALEALRKGMALADRCEERAWHAEFYRLRGIFLAAAGVAERQVKTALNAAVRTAKGQGSVTLERRAERTFSTYCRRKQKPHAGHPIRLALWRISRN